MPLQLEILFKVQFSVGSFLILMPLLKTLIYVSLIPSKFIENKSPCYTAWFSHFPPITLLIEVNNT